MKTILVLIMVIFLPTTAAFAVKVASLYQTEIPVVSQSEDAKEQAVRDGFLQVLIKLSGDGQIDKNAVIRSSLNRADYYVKDYDYSSETPDSSQYILRIGYEPTDVNRLLKTAKVSFWGERRPLILVWLVTANKQHGPDIVSDTSKDNVAASMKKAGKMYALPLIFPVMDMDEMNSITPNDVADISLDVINEATKRYSPDAVLIGEITENEQNAQSSWQLMIHDIQFNWKIDDKSTDAVVSSIMGQISHALMNEKVSGKR